MRKILAQGRANTAAFGSAFKELIAEAPWQDEVQGGPKSFAELLFAPAPAGLQIRDAVSFRPVLEILKVERRYDLYLEATGAARRLKGAPKKNVADSDISKFTRFYTPKGSSSCLDQILPRLERDHPEALQAVFENRMTPNEVARQLGLIAGRRKARLRYGCCDIDLVKSLGAKAQAKFACEIFDALGIDAQAKLIADRLEQVLGHGLAERWRTEQQPAAP